MTSKGVDYYFVNSSQYELTAQALNTDNSWALNPISVGASPLITHGNCQITWEFPYVDPYGSFQFAANTNPPQSFKESINAVTGNTSGQLDTMMKTPSIIGSDYALSYGMFDAGTGSGTGLTSQNQIYAYLTPPQQNWMGALAAANPVVRDAPLASFVLPGAHDAGTFDLKQIDTLCHSAAGLAALSSLIPLLLPNFKLLIALAAAQTRGVMIGEAVTQKDDIATMLDLGCRYFDFRPGYMVPGAKLLLPEIYHIHTVIPGQTVDGFFRDVLSWLLANPTEIVVISLGTAGFVDAGSMTPGTETLQAKFIEAQAQTHTASIQIGTKGDLQTSYLSLIQTNKRLFFLNDGGIKWNAASKFDSYTDAYETTDPQVILNALEKMKTSAPEKYDYTVLQLQATATGQNVAANVAALVDTLSNAHNPLMSTKPAMDQHTYPWVLDNAGQLSNRHLLVLLNDFVDNALAGCVASVLTLQRCKAIRAS